MNQQQSAEFTATGDMEDQFSGGVQVLLTALMSLLIVLTVLGNTLVILAFIVDRRLRTQSNFFLLNLAICDFLVGAMCVPFYIPYVLTGRWMLGIAVCKFWLVMDYLMCVASAFNVVLISYDRFLSVTMGVMYQVHQQNNTQALLKMLTVWILSFLLYGPAIIAWEHISGTSNVPERQCFSEFYYNWHFLLGASSVDFFLPFISITYFNLSICWSIGKRNRKRSPLNKTAVSVPIGDNKKSTMKPSMATKLRKDKKIAQSLGILVCIFGICWAPYTLLMCVRAACHGFCVDPLWYEITFWLLWVNSSINPFLYPLCHRHFRRAFLKVLCIRQLIFCGEIGQ
ncbi:histamine H3 receptor-like [Rhinatrema bivittatum]|uniref:histamine H3 receptor-like n=1 Tax=Rhinatrema bivittatum TaxID=194408 RepID=UPI00112C1835|nr:histamine H3 receptor-like [Rhinatrema bivittatum]